MSRPLFVTRPFLPPREEYNRYLTGIFDRACLTNKGPLVQKLEDRLRSWLGVKYLQTVSNGTVALQLALKALDIAGGEVITTPFSYVATVNSILWEGATPVFADIQADNFTLDPSNLEKLINPKTRAIMPVHVFGYACEVEAIQNVADQYDLKVIYDGAHAFGSRYKGASLLSHGDICTLSFHATKLFHTGEGGACISRRPETDKKLDILRRFGHNADDYICVGINGKMSELHAAMGLAVFDHLSEIFEKRQRLATLYDQLLGDALGRPAPQPDTEYNYAYYPVLFRNEHELLKVFQALNAEDIYPRRYFYPALNTLAYLPKRSKCPVAEDIASRVACLPFFPNMPESEVHAICDIILHTLLLKG